ncbi:hypothetical protein SPRG_07030 [Saprolegnia parasitica CBS 223.65]|uniref:RRM domain-containing protein n=1 Tax=Saprolegnia parasitica (strain CBS 223.65) TaxID=695850 RepID=A0A067CKW6_SAPPC|nr:hypothetical protein SPRG_07030 [Saprolegnia parasitica CBS 223.65]KDO27442.1 hypothetical protein SPRG_07030 [Saprolegnia parasitica CBS 223.65]|eukprot:XP_012201881.1 hypothetical protein SPRG_07030 [Saprolegnia parasitica CBS 223.65]
MTGEHRGFAFIEFADIREAREVKHQMDRTQFMGVEIGEAIDARARERRSRSPDRRNSSRDRRRRSTSRSPSRSPSREKARRSQSGSPAKRKNSFE